MQAPAAAGGDGAPSLWRAAGDRGGLDRLDGVVPLAADDIAYLEALYRPVENLLSIGSS